MGRRETDSGGERTAQTVLDYLKAPGYRPAVQRELLHRMHVPGKDRSALRQVIRRLIEQGRVRKIAGGKLVAARRREVAVVQPRGTLLGVLQVRGATAVVQPIAPAEGEPVQIPRAARMGAGHLDAVRVEVRPSAGGREARTGKIVERLGNLDEPGTDVLVVCAKYGLIQAFPPEVSECAAALPARVGPKAAEGRERFDDPAPVTIDGVTAQDFDDAIAVEELRGGGFRLYVHIADVAHFVPLDGELDREARRRGTSVYFPGRVLPMFPEALSNELCSLKPGCERLVQSAILEFSARGALRKARFADGIIRSEARLTYQQVGDLLDGVSGHAVPKRLHGMLRAADRLRDLLERRRHARGSIDFDLPEPQILLDVEGVMTGITVEPRNHAHRLIEEFMLAANEAVAARLVRGHAAALFRVHEAPDPTKLEALRRFVDGFGLRLEVDGDSIAPAAIQQMLEQAGDRPEAAVVRQVALRSMKQARYSPECTGHFGLASPEYCHFTSPIRRYPDLVVHRQLRALRRSAVGGDPHPGGSLGSLGEATSDLERKAEAAEREVLVWKKVAFIESRLGDEFDGLVTGVTNFGLFVQLIENLVEGLVRIDRLGDEFFEFDAGGFQLTGTASGTRYRLGDKLRVRVDRVDRLLQRVDLSLVDTETEGRRPRARPRRNAPRRRSRRR